MAAWYLRRPPSTFPRFFMSGDILQGDYLSDVSHQPPVDGERAMWEGVFQVRNALKD
jgi:hypothetical protein